MVRVRMYYFFRLSMCLIEPECTVSKTECTVASVQNLQLIEKPLTLTRN